MENLFSQIEAGNVKELNLIIRADVQGSVDVLKKYLSELSTEEVRLNILQAMPGGITEGDVLLAEASNAIIIGFNVVADERASGRPKPRASTSDSTTLSIASRMICGNRWPACWSRKSMNGPWVVRPFGRRSRFPGLARSPVATSPVA